ncbi:hypothetical protein RHMOL_Rhmol06G0229800 [Rhododendron molle]|uniref:Uncharacterized protein n=1 Tax=Rhododendron molle TaxID=49168 RepID=A0ACC0NHB0_RHOML|nr:hypothetical protein RHMOL_Rhmol06G0229800 [Rhododendron molle]
MNRFHLCLFFASLLFFSPTTHSLRRDFSGPSSGINPHSFRPSPTSPADREFDAEKRKVPTGSNPLHNKR